jgi:PGF-pre-PGF domain-containing protein
MEWTAGSSISGYIFSFDNCTGSFANETWTELTGITNSTNNTKTINTTSGCTIRWRVHTNDTSGHWNSSMIMSFTAVTTDGATCSLASQCVGGYCVHSYCRSLPTHAGDGYCDIGELSSPDCISSSPSTSTTSPSGSIGSSVPTIKEETNLSWVLNSSTVKEIGITTNDTGSVELNISWVEIPVSIMPAGKVYASMEVKSANSSLINKAYIDFSVNKTWLNTNRIDKTDIVLYRWTDRWEELPTGIKNENGDSILYTAETSGFSFFVIGVRGADMSTILDIENPIVYIIPRVLIISVVITIIVFGAIVKHSFRSLRKKLSR